jgi:glycosyltransferase involved in cell wall biosynthesis
MTRLEVAAGLRRSEGGPAMPPRPGISTNCRILYVVGQLRAGGLERQLYFLLAAMDRSRYRPAVVAWNLDHEDIYARRLRALNIGLHSLSAFPSRGAKIRALRRLVVRMRPEVVHSYSFYTNVAAWWTTLGTDALAVGAVQSDFIRDKSDSGPLLGRLSARWPRGQIFNSFLSAENARRSRDPFVPSRLFTVRNGLDLDLFRNIPISVDGRPRILGVGSLLPVKRWDRLIGASAELKTRGFDCLVQIAGDGPERQSLEQQARDLEVADRVQFLGYSDDVASLMATATFLVHTSDTEGCPNVVMEAMASGRAVVATDAGDTASLVENGKTGFVVRRGDDASLVSCVGALIEDRGLCRRMGDAGRAKAEREFGVRRLVDETLAVYRSLGWRDR